MGWTRGLPGNAIHNSQKISMKIFLITLLTLTMSPSMGLAQSRQEGRLRRLPFFSQPRHQTLNSRSPHTVVKVPSDAESARKQRLALGMKVFRASFLETCQTNTPQFLCECTLEGLEAEFTVEELLFKKSFSADRQRAIEARRQPIFEACLRKMQSGT